jgi:hypothetical protein
MVKVLKGLAELRGLEGVEKTLNTKIKKKKIRHRWKFKHKDKDKKQ